MRRLGGGIGRGGGNSLDYWERAVLDKRAQDRLHTIVFFTLLAVGSLVFYILHLNVSEKLQLAIVRRNWRKAKRLLDNCTKLPTTTHLGVLVEAIEAGAANAFIQDLLDKGADPNERARDDWTPLHSAMFKEASPRVAALLLSAGAQVNAANKNGSTPLHYACGKNNADLVSLLLQQRLIQVNWANHAGETPLHWAAKANALEAAECLIKAGASITLANKRSETAINVATSGEMQDLLLRALVSNNLLVLLYATKIKPLPSYIAIGRLPNELCRHLASFL